MNNLRRQDVFELANFDSSPCVSIYLPVQVAGRETRQNSTRLKNLLTDAEALLRTGWDNEPALRRQLRAVARNAEDDLMWSTRSPGMALLFAPGVTFKYLLPISVKEQATVGERFVLRPLLPAIDRHGSCYLLALSQNRVRLLRISEFSEEEIAIPGFPQNMEQVLNYVGADRGSQVHSATNLGFGKKAAVFHGQGGIPDTYKENLVAYFRQVDAVVARYVKEHPAPLLLACVDYLAPIYHSVTRLRDVVDRSLEGNSDHLSPAELRKRAWPLFEGEAKSALATRFHKLEIAQKEQLATVDSGSIILAAYDGRVETLFIDQDRELYGKFYPKERVVDIHDVPTEDDRELVELAVVETLRHHGDAHAVAANDLPTAAPMAAILRFR